MPEASAIALNLSSVEFAVVVSVCPAVLAAAGRRDTKRPRDAALPPVLALEPGMPNVLLGRPMSLLFCSVYLVGRALGLFCRVVKFAHLKFAQEFAAVRLKYGQPAIYKTVYDICSCCALSCLSRQSSYASEWPRTPCPGTVLATGSMGGTVNQIISSCSSRKNRRLTPTSSVN